MSGCPTDNSRRVGLTAPLSEPSRRRKGKAPARHDSYTPSLLDLDDQPDPQPDPEPDRDPSDDGNDDDDGDDSDDEPQARADGPTLADAIAMLANTLQNPRETPVAPSKVREPDQFDGSDSRKLRAFLMQLELNFNDRPTVFRLDRTKVNYALSYLKGTALDWFEPGLFGPGGSLEPRWLSSYADFVRELRVNFGPHDPVGDAESELERLHMKENQRITKYMVDFSRLAAQCQWGEAALRHQFYRGLPGRIKDEIARVGKPILLTELRKLAQSIDARYWERRSEISRETPTTTKNSAPSKPASEQNSKPSSSQKPSEKKADNSDRPASRPAASRPNTNATPASRNPELQGKLGKDGKLTAEERQRRFDNKLCMFCGGTGHMARDCPKRNKDQKARSATIKTTEPAPVAESSDSKK